MDKNKSDGFTLVELLIAMAIALIVMTGVYYTFQTQQTSYVTQENLSHLQQNMRAAMYFMEKDIRMAGCNPTEDAEDAGMFTMDIVNDDEVTVSDGDVEDDGEEIEYTLDWSAASGTTCIYRDSDGDGGATPQPIAENIDELQFFHLDSSGTVTNNLDRIRSIQIVIIARTGQEMRGHRDNTTYRITLPDGTVQNVFGPANDHFKRKMLTTLIRCRNLGT